jgi:hypothetical protein
VSSNTSNLRATRLCKVTLSATYKVQHGLLSDARSLKSGTATLEKSECVRPFLL